MSEYTNMMANNEELTPLQNKLLEMLKWFHDYCCSNQIRYYAAGGTLLGAIRHKGFIPWDDDIDLVLPRPDYEKLISLFNEPMNGYILETPYSGNKDYLYSFSKLYDTSTTLIENLRYKCRRGVYIDIFPLDGLGNDEFYMRNFSKIDRWNMFLMTRTCAIRKDRPTYKNAAIIISRLIPSIIIDNKELAIKIDRLAAMHDYESSDYVANVMGNYREKEIVKKHIFGNPTLYTFENIEIFGAEHYDEYLTKIYGDWRKLPSKEKQVSHHDYVELDLDKAY